MTGNGPTDPVTLDVLAEEAGVHRVTIRRWLRQAGVAVWTNPRDRRSHIVSRRDFDRLMTPRLVRGGEGAMGGA